MRFTFIQDHRRQFPTRLMCRVLQVAPAGYYDKLGPLYHLFSALTAGVWGGPHFSRLATVGEAFLRTTGFENDHPDPEKGEADICGASVAKWINAGMPDRDNYYLIGLRVATGDVACDHSFWAESDKDEEAIWHSFLRTVAFDSAAICCI